MADIYIDATNLILGRLAAYSAKLAREGNNVFIFNCDKAVISGAKEFIQQHYHEKFRKKTPKSIKGPYYYKLPDRFVRRAIRGMVEIRNERGRNAYKKIKTFIGVPEKYEKQKLVSFEKADSSKRKTLKTYSIGELCRWLGGKW